MKIGRYVHWINWSNLCDSKLVGEMGFRDIQRFNNAMLAKQVWHLFHQRDTLLFGVFSAKYFPNGNILDATVHPKCSYAWKSILQAREVIHNGAVWRVGNGQLIDIWNHRWLSKTTPRQIVSPRPTANLKKVSDLILPNSKQWNLDLIDGVFLPWEAEVIKGIYVLEDNSDDSLIWPLTPSGAYSVKSAYQMLSSATIKLTASSSSFEGFKGVWKGIWRIHVQNCVRHFMWRAVKDSLPTELSLFRRHVVADALCPLCDEAQEFILHSLWYCKQAKVVWQLVRSFAPLYGKHHRTFMDLFESVLLQHSSYDIAWFATIAWCLWQHRNRLREHKPTWPLLEVGRWARHLVDEFLKCRKWI